MNEKSKLEEKESIEYIEKKMKLKYSYSNYLSSESNGAWMTERIDELDVDFNREINTAYTIFRKDSQLKSNKDLEKLAATMNSVFFGPPAEYLRPY
uniref:Peptidase_M13_N domain-containing protein n=1 Tax=Strongyloides stercoralis TaxID=6248 RepID=A0A0K0EKR9_STRER